MSRIRDVRGFSLLEMLVAIGIVLVVGVGAVSFIRVQSVALRTQMAQTDMNDEARSVVEFMAREIRLAGYNPRCILTPAPVAAIVSAGPQTLRIQYDLNENGALDAGAADSEDVTYQYNSTAQTIERVVGGVVTTLATDIPSAGFAIRYYQSSGVEVAGSGGGGALTAAEMAAIFTIGIKFQPTKIADKRTTTNVSADLWTMVLLRNRYYPCA
jgi:prepilin-type N-terminal cleavage/methylation domain-containing protein